MTPLVAHLTILEVIAHTVGAIIAYVLIVAVASTVYHVLLPKVSPYHCTRCSRPLLRDRDYCPRCHYATVEAR